MDVGSLHHIELGVKDGTSVVDLFKKKYGFQCFAQRCRSYCTQWVLKAGKATILVTEPESKCHLENTSASANDVSMTSDKDPLFNCWWILDGNKYFNENSVYNVAFKVTDLNQVINNVIIGGGEVIISPRCIQDKHGKVDIAVVRSCIGNVFHTLLSYDDYSGEFLPGFTSMQSNLDISHKYYGQVTHIDHVAFVCNQGSTPHVVEWYKKCFSMKRFFINRYMNILKNSYCILKAHF
jgi:4-hydroxyphenylpyruvate dioxygenase-like putative hemolysin